MRGAGCYIISYVKSPRYAKINYFAYKQNNKGYAIKNQCVHKVLVLYYLIMLMVEIPRI